MSLIRKFFLSLLGTETEREDERNEVLEAIADAGPEVVSKEEADLVSGVFRLGDRTASSIMTPRNDLQWIDLDWSFEEVIRFIADSPHSFYPAAHSSLDNVLGILSIKDLALHVIDRRSDTLDALVLDPIRVDVNTPALEVLKLLKQQGRQVALVFDEFSSLDGLISMHDMLQAIVGDFSETGTITPEYSIRSDGSYLIDATMDLEDVCKLLEITEPEQDDGAEYHSLGGFVMNQLGHVPKAAEYFDYEGFRFEVVDMDRHRVDKVLVVKKK